MTTSLVVINRQRRRRIGVQRLRRLVVRAGGILRADGELALLVAGDATIRRLNATYRGKDKPTDVLSFPGTGRWVPKNTRREREARGGTARPPVLLGEPHHSPPKRRLLVGFAQARTRPRADPLAKPREARSRRSAAASGNSRKRSIETRREALINDAEEAGIFQALASDRTLGDVVISVPAAERNARRLKRSLADEIDVLVLHGFLHALGYDHETDDGTMDRIEARLRRRLLGHA